LEKEISLPSRFLATEKIGQLGTSDDGKLAYVYNMIPSSVVYVVDIALGKIVGTVDIPGCALAFPYGPNHFATMCGDGTVGAAEVTATAPAKVSFSEKFFDPDKDPIFENSVIDRTTGEGWLLSFSGTIYPASFGEKPVVGKPWSIQETAGFPAAGLGVQELAWRPGGGQLIALHRATKRLYVLMHVGTYWTHKADGTEVWVLDAEKRSLLRRIKLTSAASGIAVTQDKKPLLYVLSGFGGPGLVIYDATTGDVVRQRNISGAIALVPGL
jgi:methylamine dehydrogenase heavy chain